MDRDKQRHTFNGEARVGGTCYNLEVFFEVTYGLPKSRCPESRCTFDRHDGNE